MAFFSSPRPSLSLANFKAREQLRLRVEFCPVVHGFAFIALLSRVTLPILSNPPIRFVRDD